LVIEGSVTGVHALKNSTSTILAIGQRGLYGKTILCFTKSSVPSLRHVRWMHVAITISSFTVMQYGNRPVSKAILMTHVQPRTSVTPIHIASSSKGAPCWHSGLRPAVASEAGQVSKNIVKKARSRNPHKQKNHYAVAICLTGVAPARCLFSLTCVKKVCAFSGLRKTDEKAENNAEKSETAKATIQIFTSIENDDVRETPS